MKYEFLQTLVPAPGQSPDFKDCLAAFPVLERAKTMPQEPRYHAEVTLVYLEQSRGQLLYRDSRRETALSNRTLEGMLTRWELAAANGGASCLL